MSKFPFDPAQSPERDVWDETNCWTDFPYHDADEELQPLNKYGIKQNLGGPYICWRCGKKVKSKSSDRIFYPFCSKPCNDSASRKHAVKLGDYFKHGVQVRIEITGLPNDKKLIGTISQGQPLNALIVLNEDLGELFTKVQEELYPLVDELTENKILLCDGGGLVKVWWEDEP
jgi:hypothetical protein